jgi:5-methylcytosine-specific restriction protein A
MRRRQSIIERASARAPACYIAAAMLPTYVFAWNPKLWGWPELARDRRRIARRGHVDIEWACGRTRAIDPGSRAFFVRLGVPPKGIIGSGHTLTAPETRIHWRPEKAAVGTQTNYLMLRLEVLTDTPLITFEELARPPFSRFRWAVRQSGMRLPSSIADALEPWWEARVGRPR